MHYCICTHLTGTQPKDTSCLPRWKLSKNWCWCILQTPSFYYHRGIQVSEEEIWLMRDGSVGSSKVHSSSRAYISAEMSFKGPFTWADLKVNQQTQRHFFQWHNFNRPEAFLLLQPRSGYFYFVCQKRSFTLRAFSLRNRVSWQYCQEHIIFATEATLGKLCASLVLTGVHKYFCNCHKEPGPKCPAQVFWVATWFQRFPSLSWGRGSCTGLLLPPSTGASCPAPPPRRQRCL